METLYDILEVSNKASEEVIEKAYKILVKRYHPDLQTLQEDKIKAEEMMKKINEAYSVLSDESKRAEYDNKLQQERLQQEQQNSIRQNEQYKQDNRPDEQKYTEPNNEYNNEQSDEEKWKEWYSRLSPKEQRSVKRKIEKNAEDEYRQMYADYLRSMGYRVKHQFTLKDIKAIIITIIVFILIITLLWIIPPTHNYILELYKENPIIQVLVNIVIGIINGFKEMFSHIGNF